MPTIIEELTMTLSLDPKGFQDGAEATKSATNSLLQQIIAGLQAIEAKTQQTADNTNRIKREAESKNEADQKAADARKQAQQEAAASKAVTTAEKEAAAKRAAADKAEAAETAAAKKAELEKQAAEKRAVEARQKTGAQMEESFSKVGSSIKRAAVELLAFMGVSMTVSAAENLFMNLNKTNREAEILARNINMNAQTLKLWQATAEHFGVSPDAVSEGFSKISAEFQNYKNQRTSNMPAGSATHCISGSKKHPAASGSAGLSWRS